MPAPLYNFAAMAVRSSILDGRDDFSTVREQIRGFHQRGLIKAADHGGARGAVRVTQYEFCRARLLLVLLDLGVRSDDLARASVAINDSGRTTLPDGSVINRTLAEVMAGVRTNKRWILAGGMYADEGGTGFTVRLVRDYEVNRPFSDRNPHGDPMLPDSTPILRAFTLYAQIKIPASDLIAPLLSDA